MPSETSSSVTDPFVERSLTVAPIDLPEWTGELSASFRRQTFDTSGLDLDRWVAQLVDPGAAETTIHWGRNYLYRTQVDGRLDGVEHRFPVVVKQFSNAGAKKIADRRLRGSKALRGWAMGLAFWRSGVPTAEPLALIESRRADGPSFLITRHLPDMFESRHLFRALNAGELDTHYPGFDLGAFWNSLGATLRHMHDAGFFHRDLSIGNVLLPQGVPILRAGDLAIIDLNRARRRDVVGDIERTRDLCRLEVHGRQHQRAFVDAYWGGHATARQWSLYLSHHHGFHWKIRSKRTIRRPFRAVGAMLKPRRAHPHLQLRQVEDGASLRDRIVWDPLSDQPHQHASKMDKALVRAADAPSHLVQLGAFASKAPAIWRRYRELRHDLSKPQDLRWQGAGVCVRPFPEPELAAAGQPDMGIDPETGLQAVLDGVEALGVEHVLLRLHPWQERHDAEEALARELHQRGRELVFALPQNRDLVRDPELWKARIEELAERFVPFGKSFQIGQAINRSKWGVWTVGDYLRLARDASAILRRYPGVELVGPGVIDFELHATASIVNLPWCPSFDVLASLLYVDRRGAPENRQMGFDTVDKVLLAKAIADTSRACGPRSWVTEVNWPLWEGPHSPAGRSVSVDEESQADFLVRYFLLALTSGAVERVYWWQLIARGYGLVATRDEAGDALGLRRRPSFRAFATLEKQLRGARFVGRLPTAEGVHLLRFLVAGAGSDANGELVVGWSEHGRVAVDLPGVPSEVVLRDGQSGEAVQENRVHLDSSTRYFRI